MSGGQSLRSFKKAFKNSEGNAQLKNGNVERRKEETPPHSQSPYEGTSLLFVPRERRIALKWHRKHSDVFKLNVNACRLPKVNLSAGFLAFAPLGWLLRERASWVILTRYENIGRIQGKSANLRGNLFADGMRRLRLLTRPENAHLRKRH